MSWAQIYFDDIATTFTVISSVDYAALPGDTAFTGEYDNINCYKPKPDDTTSARFVVGNQGIGVASIYWGASFTGNLGNKTYHIAMFRNGTKLPQTSKERKLGTAGDIGAASGRAFVTSKLNDTFDIRVNAGGSTGVQVTFNHCNFGMQLVSTSTSIGTI